MALWEGFFEELFSELPEDTQARLRNGILEVGDPADAAWIVYGEPSHTFERVTETSTNTVWAYSTTETHPVDHFDQVYYPTTGQRGITRMQSDFVLQRSYLYSRTDYLRIEFNDGKVVGIDRMTSQE